eukprot:485410-Pleurochrysis_carterae.AAC.2
MARRAPNGHLLRLRRRDVHSTVTTNATLCSTATHATSFPSERPTPAKSTRLAAAAEPAAEQSVAPGLACSRIAAAASAVLQPSCCREPIPAI